MEWAKGFSWNFLSSDKVEGKYIPAIILDIHQTRFMDV